MAKRLEGLRPTRSPRRGVGAKPGLIFRGVIFDVDGTLVDSNDAHARAFERAFAERGFRVPFENIRRLIGKGSDKLIPELIGRHDEAIGERKKTIFKDEELPRLRPTPGAEELLAFLRHGEVRLAVASSAGKDELRSLLRVANAGPYFEEKTSADDAERSKPDPDIVAAALDKLQLAAKECVLVGDTPYDAEAAKRAGVAFIGVRCGGWGDTDLKPAVAVYDDPAKLLQALRGGNDSCTLSLTS